jgi:hypothetical protein
MSLAVSVGGGVGDLLAAIGLTGPDGRLDGAWFDDPIARVRKVLSDPAQRAALLRLLDELLPPHAATPGWHPLLDDDQIGNLYLTVEDNVIGLAGALTQDLADGVHITAGVRLPLVDVAGDLRPIAGTAEGPVRLEVALAFADSTLPVGGVSVDVTVDADRGAGFSARLTGVDLGDGSVDIEIDSTSLGADLVRAVQVLLDEALQAVTGDARLQRFTEHLFALLGISGADGIPVLPVEQLLARPEAVRDWLIDIVDTPATLVAWATHLAGLIGVDRPPTGAATEAEPLRAPLLAAGPVELDLMVAVTTARELQIGLAVRVDTGTANLDASATVFSLPLAGGPTRMVPHAAVLLVAPGSGRLVDNAPSVQVGTVRGGFRLDDGRVQPWLALTEVILDSVDHGTVDLTDADAVTGVVTAQVEQLLADAFGDGGQARALLALLGLADPAADPGTPHRVEPLGLLRSPLPTLAGLHRAVLADNTHSWSALLAELATLLDLPGAVTGDGTDVQPWLVPLASLGPVTLSVAAWNQPDSSTQRLRVGLHAGATVAPFTTELRSELLAIDLPQTGTGSVALVGEQRVVLRAAPLGPVTTPLGLTAGVDAVAASARWRPGDPLTWSVDVTGLAVRTGTESFGPYTWTWPQGPGPDLGPVGLGLLRLLIADALHEWGGDAAYVLGALLGLHRGLPSLPADWPVLDAQPGGLADILADPSAALRDLARRLLTGASAVGEPFATNALRIVGALLRSWDAPAGTRPDVDVTVTGGGTYADPWAIPLPGTGDGSADLLVWLDPGGPPVEWLAGRTARAASVVTGAQLADLLEALAAFDPELRSAIAGREALGAGLDALAAWLRDGDGLVPLAAQLPTGWARGTTVAAPHVLLPQDPSVIAQVRTQVAAWAAPAVYVAPQVADHTTWADLVGSSAVHVDLRALPNPADIDLRGVTGVAAHYTADLLPGATQSEVAQLERVVRRVRELTGAATVTLVAHSTAGVTARLLAAAHPELVRGMVTVGTPHTPSPLTPLTDAAAAAAVRVAAAFTGPLAGNGAGVAIGRLAATLGGAPGGLDAAARRAFTDGPAALAGIVDTVPRLAIGAALGGDPIGLLTGAALATGGVPAGPPTHAGFGVRFALDIPAAATGDVALDAHARIDLARLRLAEGAAEPPRPATAASVSLTARRPDDWLVGAEVAGGVAARVRWLEAGVAVRPSTPGAVVAEPWLRLHDADVDQPVSLDHLTALVDAARHAAEVARDARAAVVSAANSAATAAEVAAAQAAADAADTALAAAEAGRDVAAATLRRALDAVIGELATAAAGTPARTLLDLFGAMGLVFDTAEGSRTAAAQLSALVDTPAATLAAHRDALLAALENAIGGSFTLSLGTFPLELVLDVAAGALRLRSTTDLVLADPFRAGLDVTLATGSLNLTAAGRVAAGPVELVAGTDGRLTLTAPPWADQVVLRPLDPAALEQWVLELLPRTAISAAVTVLLGSRVAGALGPVDALLRDPVGWLRRTDAFGTATGALDGTKINDLLKTLAAAVGLDAADGLRLPGGYLVSASGTDPARLSLAGTFGSVTTATLHVDIAVDIHADRTVSPAATVTAAIALPGDWGIVTIEFSLDATGIGLIVSPQQNAGPIRLLPTVDGLGILIGGATALLPKLLQEAVTRLRADPGTHEILDVVLGIAAGLGIYADDAEGFTAPNRAATLRRMLEPGWLEAQAASSTTLATLLASLFGPGKVVLPAGHQIDRVDDRLRWRMPVFAGCTLSVELGWAGDGTPQVLVGLTGLDTGPVVIAEAQLGWLAGLTGRLRLTVDPGGEFAFFAPEVEVDVAGGGFGFRLLPLGTTAADHCAVTLAPAPAVVLDADGGLQLVTAWLVPLISRYLLPLVEDLLDTAIWNGGPTARGILQSAGLLEPGAGPSRLAEPLPQLPQLGIGSLGALLNGAKVHLTSTLDLTAKVDGGRLGLRVSGTVPIAGEDVDVTVLFGRSRFPSAWLTDGGVTLWVLSEDAAATPPFALDPGLSIAGLGVDVRGHDGSLVDGPLTIGGVAALVFAEVDFLDDARNVALDVSNPGGAVEVSQARVVLDSDDADSFVAKVLPKELQAGFSVAIAYRNDKVELHGGTGDSDGAIELTFGLDLDILDVIFLRELFLRLAADDGFDGLAAISGNAALGPIAITVDRVGLRVHVQGSAAAFSFKPPDGFGISLDASVVKAGGFLLVDEEHGRYVGAIELAILQKFSLTAIGIVTTRQPDGSPGSSLLLLITVQLPVPIPIGYGFFFAGAGGLLGLNRGMDVDRIRTGLRNGTADSILFPTDIIRRIDLIIRDLEESFPQQQGHFLIGPMAFIQWMNPALVSLKVGIIIEISPQPNIALLGVLRLALPTAAQAVVDLKVAFLGSIDIGAGLLAFDASIYDSFIGYGDFKLSLEGDIAIRVSWGAHPDLVASVGGFHPNYKPDASLKLPAMRRITLSLLKDNPRITLRLYFAVTSNTVQFGAQLELYVGVAGFSIAGDMGFDVLVQIVPFLIDAHMWAHLAVKAGSTDICSISLDLSLRGPTPWLAHGTASFSILFISISVEVEARFGEEQATSLPNVAVLERLLNQLRDAANWAAEILTGGSPMVSLLPVDGLVVDAAGMLTVRQNLIPLDTDIGLVGASPPSDVRRAAITAFTVGAETSFDDVTAPYAPATFAGAPTSDADRLRAPSFEQRPTGARSKGGTALVSSLAVGYRTAYERIVLDDPDQPAIPPKVTPPVAFGRLVAGGAAGRSAAAKTRRDDAERGSVTDARTGEPRYAVTGLGDLTPLDSNGDPAAELLTRSDAESRAAALAAHGHRVQIVPEVQLVQ